MNIRSTSNYYLLPKIVAVFIRLFDYLRWLPHRIYRFFKYLFRGLIGLRVIYDDGFSKVLQNKPLHRMAYWSLEVLICILDLLGIPELYETFTDFTKPKTRPLYNWEISMAKEIFGDAINYSRVRIDETAYIGAKTHHLCYVSFYIINSWGKMSNSTLIHELVHVWQYERMGSVYIPRALWAHTTVEGYNYGGLDNLKMYLKKEKTFYDFNLEQQGDIISDYFKIKNGYQPQWGSATIFDSSIYEKIIYGKLNRFSKNAKSTTAFFSKTNS